VAGKGDHVFPFCPPILLVAWCQLRETPPCVFLKAFHVIGRTEFFFLFSPLDSPLLYNKTVLLPRPTATLRCSVVVPPPGNPALSLHLVKSVLTRDAGPKSPFARFSPLCVVVERVLTVFFLTLCRYLYVLLEAAFGLSSRLIWFLVPVDPE